VNVGYPALSADTLQTTGKSGGKDLKSNAHPIAAIDLAKADAQKKIDAATMDVQDSMRCPRHNCLCYVKYDGTCGVYTMNNVHEHAKLLVSITELIIYCSMLIIHTRLRGHQVWLREKCRPQ